MSFCFVDVKELRIAGNLSVKEGETLNLSCTVEDFPSPLLIMWTKCSDRNIQNGTEINLQNNTLTDLQNSMATLSITNMTAEDSGQYTCTVKHLNKTMKENVNVTVICKYVVGHCVFIQYSNSAVVSSYWITKAEFYFLYFYELLDFNCTGIYCICSSFYCKLGFWTNRGL